PAGAAGRGGGGALQIPRPPHRRRGRGAAWGRVEEAGMSTPQRPALGELEPAGPLQVQLRKRRASGASSGFQLEAAFAAAPGVTVIVGHSGAGKTTLLRCIAGLSEPGGGR